MSRPITRDFLQQARTVINRKLAEAAQELGIESNGVGNISFNNASFTFKAEMIGSKDAVNQRVDSILSLVGFSLNETVLVPTEGGREAKIVGYKTRGRNKIIIEMGGRKYRCSPSYLAKKEVEKKPEQPANGTFIIEKK